ncbi:MAG TPA: ABC transporter permease [Candidatus Limnocylindrales bacterium]|jgi:putative ABC transport system permease protein
MKLLRNLSRRKLRTILTVSGITIGIWALVVFGSMANKINALVDGGSQYFGDKIVVSDASGGGFGVAPMEATTAAAISAIDGVEIAVPSVTVFWDELGGANFGVPDQIVGSVAGADKGHESFVLNYAQGRALTPEDEGKNVVVMGSDIARKHSVKAGDKITIHNVEFEVVGILEPTLTAPDSTAIVPLLASQQLFYETLPPVVKERLQPADLINQVTVYPKAGADIPTLARTIESTVPNTSTLTGEEFDQQVGSATAIFNAIIIGVGLISLVVGGLSVINTMAMSVAERTREIGIKRAIGGTRRRIIRELVLEAGLIGFLGGIIGLALGAIVVALANDAGRASGTVLFDLTAGTAITAVVFSTVLGMIAGIIPATHAARLDPVQALRYE